MVSSFGWQRGPAASGQSPARCEVGRVHFDFSVPIETNQVMGVMERVQGGLESLVLL
jgi:hypothetical protein